MSHKKKKTWAVAILAAVLIAGTAAAANFAAMHKFKNFSNDVLSSWDGLVDQIYDTADGERPDYTALENAAEDLTDKFEYNKRFYGTLCRIYRMPCEETDYGKDFYNEILNRLEYFDSEWIEKAGLDDIHDEKVRAELLREVNDITDLLYIMSMKPGGDVEMMPDEQAQEFTRYAAKAAKPEKENLLKACSLDKEEELAGGKSMRLYSMKNPERFFPELQQMTEVLESDGLFIEYVSKDGKQVTLKYTDWGDCGIYVYDETTDTLFEIAGERHVIYHHLRGEE